MQITNQNGYGAIPYYISNNCGFLNGPPSFDGCTTDYNTSIIKTVVDAWANDNITKDLMEVRLISIDDLLTNLGYDETKTSTGDGLEVTDNVPKMMYVDNYKYWTMSSFHDSSTAVWIVNRLGSLSSNSLYNNSIIRPVVTILKSSLGDINEVDESFQNKYDDNVSDGESIDNTNSIKVKVENTYLSQSVIIIILGFIVSSTSILIYYVIKKRKIVNNEKS